MTAQIVIMLFVGSLLLGAPLGYLFHRKLTQERLIAFYAMLAKECKEKLSDEVEEKKCVDHLSLELTVLLNIID